MESVVCCLIQDKISPKLNVYASLYVSTHIYVYVYLCMFRLINRKNLKLQTCLTSYIQC